MLLMALPAELTTARSDSERAGAYSSGTTRSKQMRSFLSLAVSLELFFFGIRIFSSANGRNDLCSGGVPGILRVSEQRPGGAWELANTLSSMNAKSFYRLFRFKQKREADLRAKFS